MQHPVDRNTYDANDPFGSLAGGRRYPHTGSDYAVREGTAVMHIAPASKVFHVGYNPGNGNYVCVYIRGYDDRVGNQGLFIAYLHLSQVSVVEGEEVNEGTRIGWSGNTGSNSNGPHLHITMSNSEQAFLGLGDKIDPYAFIEAERAKPVVKPPAPKPPVPPVPPKPVPTPAQQAKLNELLARKKSVEASLKAEQTKLPTLVKARDELVKAVTTVTDLFNKAKAALEKATADVVKTQTDRVTAEKNVAASQASIASLEKTLARLNDQIAKIK